MGRAADLDFPDPNYMPVDHHQPNFLLDCDALERMKMLEDWGNDTYNWINADKHAVYILASCIGDSFLPGKP